MSLNSPIVHSSIFEANFGTGNHLGVILDSTNWDFMDMQRFAKFTNLVETTFVEIINSNEYKIRIFTPTVEIPFAAHPSIGTAHALIEKGYIIPIDGIVYQHCKIGKIPIRVCDETEVIQLKSPKAEIKFRGFDSEGLLLNILGNVNSKPPVLINGGRNWWIVEIESESMLRGWVPNHDLIKELAKNTNSVGICAFSKIDKVNKIDKVDKIDNFDFVVRAFANGVGIIEDPASGAANGLLGYYLFTNFKDLKSYTVSQGREIGFDAKIYVDLCEEEIWVGGKSSIIIDGIVNWQKFNL